MVNRLVSVGDDFTLPAAVKAANANLPAHVQPAALAAAYAPASLSASVSAKLDATVAASTYAPIGSGGALNYVQARTDRLGSSKMQQSQARALKAKADGVAAPAATTTVTANGQRTIIYLPTVFDRATPVPLVIHFHGAGSDALSPQWQPMWQAAQAAGFAVATSDFHGNAYGSPDVVADAKAVFDKVLEFVPVNGVILSGESMGGIAALNTLTHNVLPNVLGVYLAQPVISLLHRYQNAGKAFIEAAYGINPDGSDYAAKTAGYDPHLLPASAFLGVPFYLTGAAADTAALVNPFMNEFVAKMVGVSPTTFKLATGGHGDPSMFIPADYTAFLKTCAQGLLPIVQPYNFATDPELLASFDAATLALADGAAVTSWAPTAGINTQPLAQTTPANQPVYVAADAGIGGKAVVHLNTADKRLRTDAWSVTRSTPITVITVAQFDAANSAPLWTGRTGVYVNGSTTGAGLGIGAAAVNQFTAGVGLGQTWRVVVAVYDGAASRIHVTGEPGATGTTNTTAQNANAALPGIGLNTSSDGTGAGAVRKFARFAAVGRALTTAETADVVAQLTAQYGIAA